MACFKPLQAFRAEDGSVVFSDFKPVLYSLQLPCGQCIGCRLDRSRAWATRIMHEASMHEQNHFLTLTYSPEHVPSDYSLRHSDFQKFMKRLRKKFPDREILYYMCGEYGDNFDRPHFHACIFGVDFDDKVLALRTGSGCLIYNSPTLERLWPYGFSSIGELTYESAAYVARYVMKKITGNQANDHYRMVNTETGEVYWKVPEYARMSNSRPIGSKWLDEFVTDVYPSDRVISNGVPSKPPRAYDKRFEKMDRLAFDDIRLMRDVDRLSKLGDNTPERLAVKEKLLTLKLDKLKRTL